MALDVYRIDCPKCGKVEGYAASDARDAGEPPPEADSLIEEQEFQSASGPVTKCRCPRCGTWVNADRVEPV